MRKLPRDIMDIINMARAEVDIKYDKDEVMSDNYEKILARMNMAIITNDYEKALTAANDLLKAAKEDNHGMVQENGGN